MLKMSLEYWNQLANHFILISALLAGFSITFIANLIVTETKNKISNYLLIAATIAASCFLVSVFAMTKILLMSTEGYPFEVEENAFNIPRIIGGVSFIFGIISLSTLIGISGWTKSKRMGLFTTLIGILILIIVLLVT